jgi:hypothetical protein
MLQRRCACGGTVVKGGECAQCRKKRLQTKLTVNQPGDRFEQEADRMAEFVVGRGNRVPMLSNYSLGALRREEPKKKEEETVQRKASSKGEISSVPAIVDDVLQSSGEPLAADTRRFFEKRFGYDFSRVRVHTDTRAAASVQAVNAQAYTVGHNVVFGAGHYSPASAEGQKLIAHELAHVLQQNGSAKAIRLQRKPAPVAASPTLEESDKSWIKAFGLREWFKGVIQGWEEIQAQYEAATAANFHPTESLLMGILTASRSRIDLGEEQIKTQLNGDPALLKQFRDAYRKMISVVVPKFASLTRKTATDVFQAHRGEIPDWALPTTMQAASSPMQQSGATTEQASAAPPGPSCGETINWKPESPVPERIAADSLNEFIGKAKSVIGGDPHTSTAVEFNPDTDPSGKVTMVNVTVKTAIHEVRYFGGRASDAEKALIGRAVQFTREHEVRHQDIARRVMQEALCAAKGKRSAEAQKILTKATCDTLPSAQEALDAQEGDMKLVKDSSGAVVDFKTVGIKQNYHDPNCK